MTIIFPSYPVHEVHQDKSPKKTSFIWIILMLTFLIGFLLVLMTSQNNEKTAEKEKSARLPSQHTLTPSNAAESQHISTTAIQGEPRVTVAGNGKKPYTKQSDNAQQPLSNADPVMKMVLEENTEYIIGIQQLRDFITAPVGNEYNIREPMEIYYRTLYPVEQVYRYLRMTKRYQNLMNRLLENEEASRSGLSQIEPAEFLRRLADLEAELIELQQENAMFSDEQGQPETGITNLCGYLRNQVRRTRLLAERFMEHYNQTAPQEEPQNDDDGNE